MAATTILPGAGPGTLGSLVPKFCPRPRKLLSCLCLNQHQLLHHKRLLRIPTTNSFNWNLSGSVSHSNFPNQLKYGFLQPLEASNKDDQNKTSTITDDDAFMSQRGSIMELEKEANEQTNSHIATQGCSLPHLISALKASGEKNAARFQFPGHNQGRAAPSSLTQLIGTRPLLHDFSTIPELDNLACPKGPILDAQRAASKIFGSSHTWFIVGGTTCGIHASIMATCSPGDTLILPRNSHVSATSAIVLSGALPKYIIPEYNSKWDIAGGISPSQASLYNMRETQISCNLNKPMW